MYSNFWRETSVNCSHTFHIRLEIFLMKNRTHQCDIYVWPKFCQILVDLSFSKKHFCRFVIEMDIAFLVKKIPRSAMPIQINLRFISEKYSKEQRQLWLK